MRIKFDMPAWGTFVGMTYNGYNLDYSDGAKWLVDAALGVPSVAVDKPTLLALIAAARKVTGSPNGFGDAELDAAWNAKVGGY